ncbi:hypothetical protein QA645_29825 [Bradyrhizobium sp. CIAT3101]|uniref:hypothetical protein n=1 Tax=Bradyrhizobium sp. CIAT3101 TaxID=439387 RepID=UPI0024B19147|nr:hypothetical protein [Bradyrhizobium sp. CIAT3101]WFU78705.1 hypothetical protein QA645_29825 [Bradyrhizobium sp. CIAT3101]
MRFCGRRSGAMLSFWKAEDFRPEPLGLIAAADHWEPPSRIDPRVLALEQVFEARDWDFWDPLSKRSEAPAPLLGRQSGWFDYVELPRFDARAAEQPFAPPRHRPEAEAMSERRARWLLSLLDVPAKSRHKELYQQFVELFDCFSHPSSFRAISDLALHDVTADEILCAFHLKLGWSESPKFWSVRRSRLGAPFVPDSGRAMLTWSRAARMALLAKGLPAECIIRDDWYDDWLSVPFGDPMFWSFIDYTTFRLEAFSAGALDLPHELKRDGGQASSASFGGNSLDGTLLGTPSRTGQLVRLNTDTWGLSHLTAKASEVAAN